MPNTRGSYACIPKADEVIFKDPLGTLAHVYAAFLLGVLSFERIIGQCFHNRPRKEALVPSKGRCGLREPERIK